MGRSAAEQSAMPSEKAPIIVPGRQTDADRQTEGGESERELYRERGESYTESYTERDSDRAQKKRNNDRVD